ncbi:MAG: abortive infection family protein [Nitrospinae bacterium]|nr:abortive infection family protein [Nitrospinota bacterium]
MEKLKRSDWRIINDAFDMADGYPLEFVNRTFAEFFEDEFSIEIYDEKYAFNGDSKAKRLRAFIQIEDEFTVAKVLRRLWDHRKSLAKFKQITPESEEIKKRFFELLNRFEGGGTVPRTDAIDRFKSSETLEELVSAIERDIQANKPAAALDRLHTYCMKKFAHLLSVRGIKYDQNDALHSRVGKYVKALIGERALRGLTRTAIRSSISIFDQFNDIRNNGSFAHDNDIVDHAEARFIFDSISSILRFFKSIEADHYEE